jgi:photosystem II stability/assembly factor-like uncharacterized protein
MFTKTFKSFVFLLIFGLTYTFAQPVANEHSIKFTSTTSATLVGEDGVIMRTDNQGQTWVEQNSGITNALYGNSYKNGISIAAGENGVILRSDDNGATWSVILPGTLENLNDAEVVNTTNSVVCGNNGTILFSNDGGLSWDNVTSGVTTNLLDIYFVSDQVGFISGDMSTLLKSVDGGASWHPIDLSFSNNKFNGVAATDANNITIIGDMGAIFMSSDGGNTWAGPQLTPVYEINFNDIIMFNSMEGIIAGDDGLILRTTDGGNYWYPANTSAFGEAYDLYSVAFADANIGISTGRSGVEVYTTDGGNTWSETAPITIPNINNQGPKKAGVTLLQNYPNPFNPTTNISYETAFDASVSLRVYDVTGRVVANLVSGFQKAGSHTVNFNASNLASGVYFYTLSVSSGNIEVNKIMKMILTK